MSKRAADKAYAKAGIKPSDVQVVELHGRYFCCCYCWEILVRTALSTEVSTYDFVSNFFLISEQPRIVLHSKYLDCFSANELITYEALGLCGEGQAGQLVERGDNTYGGKYVVNPSGGLISKGHPLGATGLAQCSELCWQVRNQADKRQVKGAKIGLQHNIGLGGACVVAIYRLASFNK